MIWRSRRKYALLLVKTHLSHKTSFENVWRNGLSEINDSISDCLVCFSTLYINTCFYYNYFSIFFQYIFGMYDVSMHIFAIKTSEYEI
jgi:hypothetical protein